MLDLILHGLSVISSVSGILSSKRQCDATNEIMRTVRQVEQMVNKLREEESSLNRSTEVPISVINSYNQIIDKIRLSPGYGSLVWLTYTPEGVWKVNRRKRKKTILRDPHGEYICD